MQRGEAEKNGEKVLTKSFWDGIITELSEGWQKKKEKNKPRSLNRKNRLKKTQKLLQNPLTNPKVCDIIIGLSKNGRYKKQKLEKNSRNFEKVLDKKKKM